MKTYYRVTIHKHVEVVGKRSFWMEVIREGTKRGMDIVVGWEMTEDGERTHKQHIIARDAATFKPARMNPVYAEMEIIK